MFAKNEFSGSMPQGINDLTFIQFGDPAHVRKRVIPFSDTDNDQAAATAYQASYIDAPENQLFAG